MPLPPQDSRRSHLQVWAQPGFLFQAYVNFQARSRPLASHCHDEYQFILSVDAPERYRCRGASWLVPPGGVIMFRPGEVHAAEGEPWSGHRRAPVAFWSVLLAGDLLARGSNGARRFPGGRTTACSSLHRAFVRLKASLDDPQASTLAHDAAREAFRRSLRQRGGMTESVAGTARGDCQAVARRVREFLHAHPAQDCSLAFLAGLANVSASHLCALFRREVGQSMHAYQLQRRVERAKGLLRAGAPIAQAAVESGFADQSHLHRHFQRLVGVTPGQYRSMPRPAAALRKS